MKLWANQQGIPHFSHISELKGSSSCDYLFSIVNEYTLPNSILKLAKHFAINYHDSLLPKYAGMHATSWSILGNEEWHGVSWHVIRLED